jgi:hypothetical protein
MSPPKCSPFIVAFEIYGANKGRIKVTANSVPVSFSGNKVTFQKLQHLAKIPQKHIEDDVVISLVDPLYRSRT